MVIHCLADFLIGRVSQDEVIHCEDDVTEKARDPDCWQALVPGHRLPAIRAPSRHRITLHFVMRDGDAIAGTRPCDPISAASVRAVKAPRLKPKM